MAIVRNTLELDENTIARLNALAAEKGQDPSDIVADAVVLLDSIVSVEGPDVEEDLRRLHEFDQTGQAVPFEEVRAWVESWGTSEERNRPQSRKLR